LTDAPVPDTEGLDLTPRHPSGPPATTRRRSVRNLIVLGVIGAALVLLLFQALTEARVFFYNVDEAVARQGELADDTFQMQGTVVELDSVDTNGALLFTLAFGDARADVRHVGDEPSTLFDLGEAVVVEGHWEGEVFVSRQILVKHSEAYIEDNPDRLDYEVDDPYGDAG
jgi:cytochrome c-type biogenesis protein CcmE